MKKSLEWLKARSKRAAFFTVAVNIVKTAKSPTDAHKMAREWLKHDRGAPAVDAEEILQGVRFLALIKRDYSEEEFLKFVHAVCNEERDKEFIDKVSIASVYVDILVASNEYGEGNQSRPDRKLAIWFAEFVLKVLYEFTEVYLPALSPNMQLKNVKIGNLPGYLDELLHFCSYMEQRIENNGNVLNFGEIDKAAITLRLMGMTVSEMSGIYFMRLPLKFRLHDK
jgi:hypothetical protein